MDRAEAIERNRATLTAILAALFAMLGLTGGGTLGRIPRTLHRAVLRVLWPAEAAVRRLIVVAAKGLVVKPVASHPVPAGGIARKGGARPPAFPLFDPRKRFDRPPRRRYFSERNAPRVAFYWNADGELVSPPRPPPPPPDDGRIDAARLGRRLEAIKQALADLPRQARRLARARLRREKVPHLRMQSPLRPGWPPGYRKNPTHDVDDVLINCHELARDAMAPDTS